MNLSRWNLLGTSFEDLTSLSISHNVQADCTVNASYRMPYDGIGSLPKIGSTVTYSVRLFKKIDALNIGLGDPYIDILLITGTVKTFAIDQNTYQITATTDFNNFVKAGKVQELSFMTSEELMALFDIVATPTIAQQREFFDAACKFKGAVYYSNSSNYSTVGRKTIDDIILSSATQAAVPTSFLSSSGSISSSRDDNSNADSTPNIYDIIYNVKFTRVDTLVKTIAIAPDSTRPGGLRTVVQLPVGDGTTYEAYATYDRPPKKSVVMQAIQSAGWTVDNSSITATYATANILDIDNATIIHTVDSSDDLISMTLKATRHFNQNVSLPIVCRLYNRNAIRNIGQVNYKRIEKTFTYNYIDGMKGSTILSNYYDVLGNTYLQDMDAFILKAKYEMKNTGLSKLTGSYTENIIISYGMYSASVNTANLMKDALPLKYRSNIGEDVIIMGRSFNFDVNSGSATLTLQCKAIKNLNSIAPVQGDVTIPETVVIQSNSNPNNTAGGGLLSVNGPSSWWTNDTYWDFETTVNLKHSYSYYIASASLQENADPELTLTNYYMHDTYKNEKYLGVPFPPTNEQCRIKYDKQKPLYTLAISLPQITYTDIEL